MNDEIYRRAERMRAERDSDAASIGAIQNRTYDALADLQRTLEDILADLPEAKYMTPAKIVTLENARFDDESDDFWHYPHGAVYLYVGGMTITYNPYTGTWRPRTIDSINPTNRHTVVEVFKEHVASWIVNEYPAAKAEWERRNPRRQSSGCLVLLAPLLGGGLLVGLNLLGA